MLVKRANREFLRLRNTSTSVFYSPAAAVLQTIKNDSKPVETDQLLTKQNTPPQNLCKRQLKNNTKPV